LISALSTGNNIQAKLDNAIKATDARLLDPSASATTTDDDALDHLCVVLKHFMSEVETWVRNVDEVRYSPTACGRLVSSAEFQKLMSCHWQILIINRQYLADGSRSNPLSRLFSGAFAPVEIRHLRVVPNNPSVFMPSEPAAVPLPAVMDPHIQPVLPF
jgi:hypothetical protein